MKKITIIGGGEVGQKTLAAILATFPKDKELLVVWRNRDVQDQEENNKSRNKIIGIKQDLEGLNQKNIRIQIAESNDDLKDSDVIIYTAGISSASIGSKKREAALPFIREMIKKDAQTIEDLYKDSNKKPAVFMITNPVDIATLFFQQHSELPHNKIIGSGTFLDSRRFCRILKNKLIQKEIIKPDQEISADVIGGHSEQEMIVVENSIKIGALGLKSFCAQNSQNSELIMHLVRDSKEKMKKEGFEIVKLSGHGASFEPAVILAFMTYAYLYNQEMKITGSTAISRQEFDQIFADKIKKEKSYLENPEDISTISLPLTIKHGQITIDLERCKSLNQDEVNQLKEIFNNHRNLFNQTDKIPMKLTPSSEIKGKETKQLYNQQEEQRQEPKPRL